MASIALANSNERIVLCALILAGLGLRLYGFDAPIFDHHWLRQVDTAALARNFADEGMNFFYPRVDWRGASPGFVESEFPIYTYMIAALHLLTGAEIPQTARALNLLLFALSALTLFDFARRMFDAPRALLTVFFYSANPLSAFFTHSVQPDTLLMLTTIGGLNFFWKWCDSGRGLDYAISVIALSVAVLIKPQSLYLGAPLLFLCFQRFGWKLFLQPLLWVFGVFVLVPAVLWYRHAYTLWVEYGNTLFRAYTDFGQTALWSPSFPEKIISLNTPSYASQLTWRLINVLAVVGGLVPLFIGLRAAIRERNGLLLTWLGAFALTMAVFALQNFGHDYYQLPLVFIAALLMADGVARLWRGAPAPRLLAAAIGVFYVLATLWFQRFWQARESGLSTGELIIHACALLVIAAFVLLPKPGRIASVAAMLLVAVAASAK